MGATTCNARNNVSPMKLLKIKLDEQLCMWTEDRKSLDLFNAGYMPAHNMRSHFGALLAWTIHTLHTGATNED